MKSDSGEKLSEGFANVEQLSTEQQMHLCGQQSEQICRKQICWMSISAVRRKSFYVV